MQVIENKALLSETTRLPGAREVPPPLCFSQVLILKVVKVLYFDTLLQVFILKKLVRSERKQESGGID